MALAIATTIGVMPTPSISCFFRLVHKLNEISADFYWLEGSPYLQQNRTQILERIVRGKKEYEYLLWIDADQIFTVEQVDRMLQIAKEEKTDMLTATYFNRHGRKHSMMARIISQYGDLQWLSGEDVEGRHLIEIDVCGFGFVLLAMDKVKGYCSRIPREKWYACEWHGKDKTGYSGEDVTFCKQWKELGYNLYGTGEVIVGHYGAIVPSSFRYYNSYDKVNAIEVKE